MTVYSSSVPVVYQAAILCAGLLLFAAFLARRKLVSGEGVIPDEQAEDLVIVCGVFIHPEAADNQKIEDYNYAATKESIARAMSDSPSAAEMLAGKDDAVHPFGAAATSGGGDDG